MKSSIRILTTVVLIVQMVTTATWSQHTFKRDVTIMGCKFDITVVALDQPSADGYIDLAIDEMSRIERLISSWDPNSQTSNINQQAGIRAVKVDVELFELIQRALKISRITDGAFDISYASMDRIWKFDGSMNTKPSEEQILNSVARVGYKKIILNAADTSVFLIEEGMKIGFGAIGKGYAADRAKALLKTKGVQAGIINASGDMNTWGKQVNGEDWKIAITNPMNPQESYGLLPLDKGAVVTSGNYENYAMIDGQRFAHIIDPRTGWPTRGIVSVTIFSPSAELADAIATSVFVMGIEVGLDRINQLPHLDGIIVDDQGGLHYSKNIKIHAQ